MVVGGKHVSSQDSQGGSRFTKQEGFSARVAVGETVIGEARVLLSPGGSVEQGGWIVYLPVLPRSSVFAGRDVGWKQR